MKLNNVLLIILICLIAFQKLPLKEKRGVLKNQGIVIKNQQVQTKSVPVVSTKKDDVKQSSTFRQYIDSSGNSTERLSHNIRIGKEYYLSGGIYTRQSEFRNDVGGDISLTKFW